MPIETIYDGHAVWADRMLVVIEQLLDGSELETPEGRDDFLCKALLWDDSQPSANNLWIKRFFWPEVCRLAQVDNEYVLDHVSAWRERDKRRRAEAVVQQALSSASDTENPEIARESVLDAFAIADEILAERPLNPIRSLADSMAEMFERLKRMQGVKHPGFVQKTLPQLDDATGGLQGLTLMSAASGGGKTTLALQMILDILQNDSDICALIVSCDMLEWRIQDRLLTNRAQLPIRVVQSGSTDKGWTPDEKATVNRAACDLRLLGERIRILDRYNFPYASRHNIRREMDRLMDAARVSHCVVLIDFLQLMPVPPKLRNLEIDDYLIEEVRDLADGCGNDPVIVIAESTKSTQGEKGSNQNVKGSNRILMRSDCILTLSEWDAMDLVSYYDINNGGLIRRQAEADLKKAAEMMKLAKQIRKLLDVKGEAPIMLKIGKARDGATKTEFNVIHHFQKSLVTPWLEM